MSSSLTSVRSRRRSRSSSGSHRYSRSRTYSRSDSDQYSDGTFYSDDDNVSRHSTKPAKGKQQKHPYAQKTNKKRGAVNKKTAVMTPRSVDTLKQRLQSARRKKVSEIKNELEDVKLQLQEVQQENKILKKQQRLQDKAIVKFQATENDFPQLIRRHSAELRAAREQLRVQKERNRALEHKLHDKNDEYEHMKKQLGRMKTLVEEKNLGERDELSRNLTRAEAEMEEIKDKNKELQKHVENLKKNHRHEIGIERARHKETKQQLSEVTRTVDTVQGQLKEKEKELDIKNIYSNRVMKPPHKLNSSVSSSPAVPQYRTRKHSDPMLNTSRNRAKQYERQRREEQRLREDDIFDGDSDDQEGDLQREQEARRREELYAEQQETERRRVEQEEHNRELERLRALGDTEQEQRLQREREQQEEQRRREEQQRREDQQREERERRERQRQEEEEERQWREEREKRKREAEVYEREKREREERLAREREEEKRRREVAAQQENQEERQKKDLLLARLKEMDANKDGSGSRRGSTNEYSFSKPIDNMHHGLPAYDSPVGRTRGRHLAMDQSDNDVGGYQPSFEPKSKRSAGSGGPVRHAKKSDLMTELFGASTTVKTSPVQQPPDDSLFLTTLNNNNTSSTKMRHHDTSMTLFGGGSAFLEDDHNEVPPRNQTLLPRRGRQPTTTIHTRPTINAIDDFDDDIEEVIL